MKGFIELQRTERIALVGGKDPSMARLIEVIGYIFGMVVRTVRDLWGQNLPYAVCGLKSK